MRTNLARYSIYEVLPKTRNHSEPCPIDRAFIIFRFITYTMYKIFVSIKIRQESLAVFLKKITVTSDD